MKNYKEIIEKINNTTAKEIEKIRNESSENEIRLRTKIEELKNELVKLHDVATANEADVKKNADTEVNIIKSMIAAESEVKTAQAAFDEAAKVAHEAVENDALDLMVIGAMGVKREARSALEEAKKKAEEICEKADVIVAKYEKKESKEVPVQKKEVVVANNEDIFATNYHICYSTDDHPVITPSTTQKPKDTRKKPKDGGIYALEIDERGRRSINYRKKLDVEPHIDNAFSEVYWNLKAGNYKFFFKNLDRPDKTIYVTGCEAVSVAE